MNETEGSNEPEPGRPAGESLTRELLRRMDKALEEDQKCRTMIVEAEISDEDREVVRCKLLEAAEHIRHKYVLPIPAVKNFLYEMVEVSV